MMSWKCQLYRLMAAGEPEIAHLQSSDERRIAWWTASEELAAIMCSAANLYDSETSD
jgi:hypothetical protein